MFNIQGEQEPILQKIKHLAEEMKLDDLCKILNDPNQHQSLLIKEQVHWKKNIYI
jgi:hypothetical protein